jgi:putative membrane protein
MSLPAMAFAHGIEPGKSHEIWRLWKWEPWIVAPLALTGWFYARGARRLWHEAGRGQGLRVWEATCYGAGWTTLVIALLSPLHPLGEVLFAAHMTQHELLMLVAAPLLVLGRPMVAYVWAMPKTWRRTVGRIPRARWVARPWSVLTTPLAAWSIHAFALWIWHAPSLFQATLLSDTVHTLQHASFLGSALFFWWALVHARAGPNGFGAAVLYLFTTALHSGVLGALLTFTSQLLYPAYGQTAPQWGMNPIDDQQLGGLIMWIPAGMVYVFAGLVLFAGWLRDSEARLGTTWGTRLHDWPTEKQDYGSGATIPVTENRRASTAQDSKVSARS